MLFGDLPDPRFDAIVFSQAKYVQKMKYQKRYPKF